MATRAPSFARRKAMPRPMRLAAPVTKITLPDRLDGWFSMHLHLAAFYALHWRLGQAPPDICPRPEYGGGRAQRSSHGGDPAGAVMQRRDARERNRNQHDGLHHGLHGGEYTAAVFIGNVPEQLRHIQDRADGDGRARESDKKERQRIVLHLAEDDVSGAVQDVAYRDGALIRAEADAITQPVREPATHQQAHPGAAPYLANASGSAVEHDLTEKAEQDLRRSAAGGPAHADERDAEYQRVGAHVSQAFHVLVPWADDFRFGKPGLPRLERVAF